MAAVVHSLKVLSLSGVKLCLHTVINLLKCFPQLEKLFIKVTPCTMTKMCMHSNAECMFEFDHLLFIISMIVLKLSLTIDTISLFTCFFQVTSVCVENDWYQTNPERIGTHDIRVRKIVLENYQESKSHVDFVNFFFIKCENVGVTRVRN
jgi:hypothetical protein